MPTVLATRALLGMQHKVSALRQTRRIHVEIHHAPLPSSLSWTSSQNRIRDSHSHSHGSDSLHHAPQLRHALQQHPPFISSVDMESSEGVALAASSSSQEVVPGVMEGLLRMDEHSHSDMDNAVPDEMVQLYPGETVCVRILRPATKREQHMNMNMNVNLSCDEALEDQYGYYNNGEDGEMIHSSDHGHENENDDVASVSTLGIHGADDVYKEGVISHWVCTHRLALDQCTIVRSTTGSTTCDIRLGGGSGGVGKKTIKRHLKFANAKEAKTFVTFLQTLHNATKSQQQSQQQSQSQQAQSQPVALPFRHTSSTSLQDELFLSNSSSSLLLDMPTNDDDDDDGDDNHDTLEQQQALLPMKLYGDSQYHDTSKQQIMEPVTMEKDRVVSATTALDRNVTRRTMSPLNGGEFLFSTPRTILVELVSATDLIASSSSSLLFENDCQTNRNGAESTTIERAACNPFCSVYQGTNEIHRTPPIHQTNHPIWTVPTGSLFLISISQPQSQQDSLILFRLTHFVSSNDDNNDNDHYHIGSVHISEQTLLQGMGDRVEFPLQGSGSEKEHAKLVLRYRLATTEDVHFIMSTSSTRIAHANEPLWPEASQSIAPRTFVEDATIRNFNRRRRRGNSIHDNDSRTVPLGENGTQQQFRVKPYPDIDRREETQWMDKNDLKENSLAPSRTWIESGHGEAKTLYCEVLSCQGLLQTTQTYQVDHMNTPTTPATSPFVFLMCEDMMVSTDVILNCKDPQWMAWTRRAFCFHMTNSSSSLYVGVFSLDDTDDGHHKPMGRIALNTHSFRHGSTYTLHYRFNSQQGSTTNSSICLRIRASIPNERTALLHSLERPVTRKVHVVSEAHVRLARFTCEGKIGEEQSSMEGLARHSQEFIDYMRRLTKIKETMTDVIFWRPVNRRDPSSENCFDALRLRSVSLFIACISCVEAPRLIPSFACLAVSVLFGVTEQQQRRVLRWKRSRSYVGLWKVLLTNEDQCHAEKRNIIEEREDSEYEHHYSLSRDDSLLWLEQALSNSLVKLRSASNIMSWQDSYASFWIANCALLLVLPLAFIPWSLVIRWGARIMVWTLLGPWMILLDRHISRQSPEKDRLCRIKQEKETKEYAMKQYLFGKSIVRIPPGAAHGYHDDPVPFCWSCVSPDGSNQTNPPQSMVRLPDQRITCDMTPKRVSSVWNDETQGLYQKRGGISEESVSTDEEFRPLIISNETNEMYGAV
uniref:C2 domain-containing protein n=1 Tax=Attheya septentrionalis TaxID=420275 RepID=A0A6T7HEA3_9STRA|mmetsp:Transcript_20419/g.36988  ORF Transcript_20419/g.36988 Transcript_20419/m.36988 type:complete len:1218 (+) Transcript_20419:218-3871(+)